jgi:GNAT superfamily N-acetyltransferase
VLIRPLEDGDRAWVSELIAQEWGLPVVSISGHYDPGLLPGLIAERDGYRLGVLTYRHGSDGCEVVVLFSRVESQGVGRALMERARLVAAETGDRLWLITTNENIRAIRFYQQLGMDLVRLHRNFADVVAAHKIVPVPQEGGIRFRHGLEFELPPAP